MVNDSIACQEFRVIIRTLIVFNYYLFINQVNVKNAYRYVRRLPLNASKQYKLDFYRK